MIVRIPGVEIECLATAVPRTVCDFRSDTSRFGLDETERIIRSTGISRVRKTTDSETAADLCVAAAENLFQQNPSLRSEVDALVYVTITPDYICPQTSPALHQRLVLRKDAPCVDLSYGCSGYIYGLWQASMMISSLGINRVLVLAGETMSKAVDPNDRATALIFGDGGSATLVAKSKDKDICLALGSDGRGNHSVRIPSSGFKKSDEPRRVFMDGTEIVNFVIREIPDHISQLFKFAKVSADDIELAVFHQASDMILKYLERSLKLSGRCPTSGLQQFGNTGSASIPLTLSTASPGPSRLAKNTLLCGFGVGLSWGSALVDLSHTLILPPLDV